MSESDDRSRYLRTEFLERVAHELRGPAGVTLGALDEIEHALGPDVVAQNRILFAMARRGVRRVLRTADRLSRTAQLEGGTAHVTRMPADLRTLVKQAVQDAELIEGRSSVKVALRLPDEPSAAEIDGAWLSMAVMELVGQAIRCARREVDVSVQVRGGQLRLAIGDDRQAEMPMPSVRFESIEDRRDSALNWPLIHDVARAHGATLTPETLRDDTGAVTGFRISLDLAALANAQLSASAAQ